jgi:hypothetical protein
VNTPMIAPVPTNNYEAYRMACAEAAAQPPADWAFKRDPRYRRILEHVPPEHGEAYLAQIAEEFPNVWANHRPLLRQTARLNDRWGRPLVSRFPALSDDTECSPTTLRYLYQALRVWRHAEGLGLPYLRVVELGGGYGGMALCVYRLAPLFHPRLAPYTVVDVPEAGALQRAYARCVDFPLRTAADPESGHSRFFVSVYAFSEFDADTRAWYEPRLVRRCAHGFVVWNFPAPVVGVAEKPLGGPLYPFVDAPLTTEPERPSIEPGHLVVTW